MKNLFLEGPSGCGKTSLIISALGSDIRRAGGFATVRLKQQDGTLAGFRVIRASQMQSPDELYRDGTENVFLRFEPDAFTQTKHSCSEPEGSSPRRRVERNEQTFIQFATRVLNESSNAPYLVMDEFGGLELTDAVFADLLKNAIASDTPIIGVIKSRANALKMQKNVGLGGDFSETYDAFRDYVEKTDSVIVNPAECGSEQVLQLIETWKRDNLS